MDAVEAFSNVLRELRLARKLSQEELAHASGLDRTYISLLERAARQPTLKTLMSLASALGVSASKLIVEVEDAASKGAAERGRKRRL